MCSESTSLESNALPSCIWKELLSILNSHLSPWVGWLSMATSFTVYGMIWVITSALAAVLTCTSFYLPHWLTGELFNVTIDFGIFRRCNYPMKDINDQLHVVHRCGRYTSFSDIPTVSWQVCTILMGVACAVLILVALTVSLACCIKDVLGRNSAKTCGIFQGVAGK